MKKIQDVQDSLRETILRALPVEIASGFEAQVSIKHKNGRKIKSNASAECFQPGEGDEIVVTFLRVSVSHSAHAATHDLPPNAAAAGNTPPLSALSVRLAHVLDQALSDPRYRFVALKWFRDTELLRAGFSPDQARFELSLAIRQGWVRVEKLANPNSNFPTSTLQLDRNHPAVREALASSLPPSPASGAPPAATPRRTFQPMRLPPGVSVSRMIIEDRR